MWYKRKTAINTETGQSYNVVAGMSDWEEDLYPTMFFTYFNDCKTYDTFTLLFSELEEFTTLAFDLFAGEEPSKIDKKPSIKGVENGRNIKKFG